MPHYNEYRCTCCGDVFETGDSLVRKLVNFVALGGGSKVELSRTVAWLCRRKCMLADPDYQRKPFTAPGMKSPALERVRLAKENGNVNR